MSEKTSPIRPTDDASRALARSLVANARTAAIAFIHPEDGTPYISRIGFGMTPSGLPFSLISDLALHTGALRKNPAAALLVGEPGPKGDPLNSPRLSLSVRAEFLESRPDENEMLRETWLAQHPKAGLYIGFPDFRFVGFTILSASLNGGFGRAHMLTPEDFA